MSLLDLQVKETRGIGQLVSHYIRPILLRRSWRRASCYLPLPAPSPKPFPLNRQNSALSCFCWGFVKRDTPFPQIRSPFRYLGGNSGAASDNTNFLRFGLWISRLFEPFSA